MMVSGESKQPLSGVWIPPIDLFGVIHMQLILSMFYTFPYLSNGPASRNVSPEEMT